MSRNDCLVCNDTSDTLGDINQLKYMAAINTYQDTKTQHCTNLADRLHMLPVQEATSSPLSVETLCTGIVVMDVVHVTCSCDRCE